MGGWPSARSACATSSHFRGSGGASSVPREVGTPPCSGGFFSSVRFSETVPNQLNSRSQKFVTRRDDESTNVRTGNSSRLLPRLCLARAPTLPPCTRARCSRRARHARCSRRARARASPRMRATNDVGVPMSPLSLPARLLSALRSTAPCTRARVYRARSSRTHARLTCARAAWRWRARRFGLTSLDVSHVDVAFADTQNDEDDERDDDERDDD